MHYYYLYRITNLLNNKIYIGVHQTSNINDRYLGSGKLLKADIQKYGRNSFKKEILEYFNTKEEMLYREAEIVNKNFYLREDTYNIMPGGGMGTKDGNGLTFSGRRHSDDTKASLREKALNRKCSEETKQKQREYNFARKDPIRQREHARKAASGPKTEEHKNKIRETLLRYNKEHTVRGINHSNFGLKRLQIECPHCKIKGAKNTLSRFHFDNCKYLRSGAIGSAAEFGSAG